MINCQNFHDYINSCKRNNSSYACISQFCKQQKFYFILLKQPPEVSICLPPKVLMLPETKGSLSSFTAFSNKNPYNIPCQCLGNHALQGLNLHLFLIAKATVVIVLINDESLFSNNTNIRKINLSHPTGTAPVM